MQDMKDYNIFSVIDEYKNAKPPVPIYKLISELGINLIKRFFDDDVSGTIERKDDGTYLIHINSGDSHTRQRFTAAHELGHYIFHRNQIDMKAIGDTRMYRRPSGLMYNSTIEQEEETQANQFAANLLMPLSHIREFKKQGLSCDEMADALNVSKQAMKIRYDAIFLKD